jgi:hypothetical protein
VLDNTPPTLVCPAPVTVCEEEPLNISVPTATDNCDDAVEVSWERPGPDGTVILSSVGGDDINTPFDCAGTYTFTFTATDDCGNTTSCTMDVTVNPCSWIYLIKTTNDVIDPTQTWTFSLFEGIYPDNAQHIKTESTLGVEDGILFRDVGPLSKCKDYSICELGVPAGFGTSWFIDPGESDADGLPNSFFEDAISYTLYPGTEGVYNPNSVDQPMQDLGNRCYTITGDQLLKNLYGDDTPIEFGFLVDNTFPGGEARTPGYWKNWNTCTGGNQQYTADKNASDKDGDGEITAYDRVQSGWALLNDLLPIQWVEMDDEGQPVPDACQLEFTTCEEAKLILDNRDLDGIVRSSDPAYNLAKHLMTYQLNQGAGAYLCPSMLPLEVEAVNVLMSLCFDGHGEYLKKTNKPTLRQMANRANELAGIFDDYNNNLGCYEGPEPTPDEPTAELTPVCPADMNIRCNFKNAAKNFETWKASFAYTGGCNVVEQLVFSPNDQLPACGEQVVGTYTVTSTCDGIETVITCTSTFTVGSAKSAEILPEDTPETLEASELKVYPNPFSDKLTFEFVSDVDAHAVLEINNVVGQRVRTLMDQPVEKGVKNHVEYTPTHEISGIYIYRLKLNDEIQIGKVIYKKR